VLFSQLLALGTCVASCFLGHGLEFLDKSPVSNSADWSISMELPVDDVDTCLLRFGVLSILL
jgi:hypothetical protein